MSEAQDVQKSSRGEEIENCDDKVEFERLTCEASRRWYSDEYGRWICGNLLCSGNIVRTSRGITYQPKFVKM